MPKDCHNLVADSCEKRYEEYVGFAELAGTTSYSPILDVACGF